MVEPGQRIVGVVLVVAADPVDAERGTKLGEGCEVVAYELDGAVGEISAENDEVGLLFVDLIDDSLHESGAPRRADVQIRDQGDAESVEPVRESGQSDGGVDESGVGRFDQAAIADRGDCGGDERARCDTQGTAWWSFGGVEVGGVVGAEPTYESRSEAEYSDDEDSEDQVEPGGEPAVADESQWACPYGVEDGAGDRRGQRYDE